MKIAYTCLVVTDVDPDADAGAEWRELSAQLRLAAQHVVTAGAPEPSDSERITSTARTVTVLSAVELPDYDDAPQHVVAPDPWFDPDAASAHQPPPF